MSLAAISEEKLLEIQTAIVDAGICNEFKGDHKTIFKLLRNKASGKQKKIYAALGSANRDQMRRMADLIIDYKQTPKLPAPIVQPILLESSE
jgi:hypothetical protein